MIPRPGWSRHSRPKQRQVCIIITLSHWPVYRKVDVRDRNNPRLIANTTVPDRVCGATPLKAIKKEIRTYLLRIKVDNYVALFPASGPSRQELVSSTVVCNVFRPHRFCFFCMLRFLAACIVVYVRGGIFGIVVFGHEDTVGFRCIHDIDWLRLNIKLDW